MNAFIANLDVNIEDAIESNQEGIINLNREQMILSSGNDGKPLIHKSTGKATLTPAYARKTGKTHPNIYEDGSFQKGMELYIGSGAKTYDISSRHWLDRYLPLNYSNLYGIMQANAYRAYSVTNKAIGGMLKKMVFINN